MKPSFARVAHAAVSQAAPGFGEGRSAVVVRVPASAVRLRGFGATADVGESTEAEETNSRSNKAFDPHRSHGI
jgi:hypothetical protein